MIRLEWRGMSGLLRSIRDYKQWIQNKTDELASELAKYGYSVSYTVLSEHVYSGATLGSLKVEKTGCAQYVVKAESEAILFLEFGSGLKGYGHPEPLSYGPGTYPGQTHAFDPRGWWYETDDPALAVRKNEKTGKMYGHSYGNPPYMPMYGAVKEIENNFDDIVKRVFVR